MSMCLFAYAAPAWEITLEAKTNTLLQQLQRRILLRVTYRTVAGMSVGVIAGIPPIHLVVEEQAMLFKVRRDDRPRRKLSVREQTLRRWQRLWTRCEVTTN